jgi:transposase-like protein
MSIDKPRRGHNPATIAFAVWLYLSGVSQRRIARLFDVTPVAVLKWIKRFALQNAPKPVPSEEGVAVVELDERWHFLKKIQPGVDREGLLSCYKTAH